MRTATLLAALAAAAWATPAGAAAPPNHKLKLGAEGALCLDCHKEFGPKLKLAAVHTPVRSRECVGCHAPHASSRPKLLSAEPSATCASCHPKLVPAEAKSTHAPVAEQKCLACHDPHASANKGVLVKPALELCAGCHKPLVERVQKARVKHAPLQSGGCAACHVAHASDKAGALLKKPVPALCTDCHKTDRPTFAKQHLGYKVADADCSSCHDPHGSNQKGMLFDRVHSPVARGMCTQCHDAPGAAKPFATKAAGVELCRGCHGPMVAKVLGSNRVHLPVVSGDTCLGCHNPHASKEAKLLAGPPKELCGSCHVDTIQRDVRAAAHHEPVREGACMTCHDPHAGSGPLLFTNTNTIALCKSCHEWDQHSTHPLGEEIADPRNPNLGLDCLSCHRSHGTEYKKLMPFPKHSDLCTSCHEQYRR